VPRARDRTKQRDGNKTLASAQASWTAIINIQALTSPTFNGAAAAVPKALG